MQERTHCFIIQNDMWQFESRTICSCVQSQELNWVHIFFTLTILISCLKLILITINYHFVLI